MTLGGLFLLKKENKLNQKKNGIEKQKRQHIS